MREIGVGYAGMTTYSTMMNMHQPLYKPAFQKLLSQAHTAYVKSARQFIKDAA